MIARRTMYIAGAALGLAALLAWAFTPRPLPVEVAPVTVGTFETAVEDDGKTRLLDQYLVSAPLAGQLQRITLREGDAVAPGAVVAQLRPVRSPLLDERSRRQQEARLAASRAQADAASALLARAEVALRRARADYARSEQLGQAGFVAESRLENERLAVQAAQRERDSAQAQRQAALYDVEQARAVLDAGPEDAASGNDGARASALVPVRAPAGGRVLRLIQASEATVQAGAPLLELGDPGRMEVMAELLTADAIQAKPGSPVRIDRWGGAPLAGRVRRVEPAAFTKISALGVEEQRVRVLIDILDAQGAAPAPGTAGLGVGYRVNVRILTSRQEQVRKVPVSAVFPLPGRAGSDPGAMGVYLVDGGRARLAQVKLGGRNDSEAWVLEGLAPGQRVIVYPPAEIRDGERVRVRDVAREL